jgi:DNA repair protein RadC
MQKPSKIPSDPRAMEERPQSQTSFFDARLTASPVQSTAQPVTTAEPEQKPKADDNPHAGHRKRLRERFLKTGPEGLPDYELLELVLFNAIPRRDTKQLAKDILRACHGSFAEAIHKADSELLKIPGVTSAVICEFRLLQAVALRLAKAGFVEKPALSSWQQVLDYLRLAQGYADREQFRILFLDKKNMLIADEVQGRGTVDHTPVYIREVVKRALELSASGLILVHNHPSGDPTPSRADIDMTRMIVDAARPLGIVVHDHVIVGRQGHASLKALRLM